MEENKKNGAKSLENKRILEEVVGDLGLYKVFLTEDGTPTLFSPHFEENCHSLAGAYEETLHNYVEGCKVISRAQVKDPDIIFTVFEIGFATGLGLKCTWEEWQKHLPELKRPVLQFISSELDHKLALYSLKDVSKKFHLSPPELITKGELRYYQIEVPHQIRVVVLLGDVRKSAPLWLKSFPETKVDAFYQDPFSPKKNPLLWTKEWFETCHQLAAPNALLASYSSTKAVMKALDEAGWKVWTEIGFGPKKESLRACASGETSKEMRELLSHSPREAFKDDDFS